MNSTESSRLLSFGNISDSLSRYYDKGGFGRGLSTGWRSVDDYFTLQKGMLHIITGIPSSGKSEWLDQLMLNTIALHNWHWTVFSPENWPLQSHFQKLAEKWVGKPMFGIPGGFSPMSKEEMASAITDLSGSMEFISLSQQDMTVSPILDLVKQSKDEFSTDAFLLDPFNELEHNRPASMSETEYIGKTLTKLRNFGRVNNIAMFIVAHPTKLAKNDDGVYPVPTPYDISGSANWRNKADACISVWRDYQANDGIVQLHFQKIRNKYLGKLGQVNLQWFFPNGLFFESQDEVKEYIRHGVHRKRI